VGVALKDEIGSDFTLMENSNTLRKTFAEEHPDRVKKLMRQRKSGAITNLRRKIKMITVPYLRRLTREHLYDSDFYAWTQEQAKLLRQQRVNQ